jgi:hypothetical protein
MAGEDNQLQLESFLRFSKFKREQHVKEILATIEEFEGYRVQDGVCGTRHASCAVAQGVTRGVRCAGDVLHCRGARPAAGSHHRAEARGLQGDTPPCG